MSPSISFGGLLSGIDTESIIKAIVDSRRFSLTTLQDRISEVQDFKTTLRFVNTQMLALQKASLQLRLQSTFQSKKVQISNPALLNAIADLDAAPVQASLTIAQLARGARATSGLGSTALDRAAAALIQGNTAGLNGVQMTSTRLIGTRARATDQLGATLQAGRGPAAPTVGDTITITGSRKDTTPVSATFTFAGDGTDTLQRLATAVQAAFGGDVTASVGSSGQLVLTESDITDPGNFALSGLTFNDADLSGSTFTIGLGAAQASGGPTTREVAGTVVFTTTDSAIIATGITLLNDLDQLTGGPLDDGSDTVEIQLSQPGGTLVNTTYTYANGDTLDDLLAEVNTAYAGTAVASVVNGRIIVTDAVSGESETSLGLTFHNAGVTTHSLSFGPFIPTISGAAETKQVATSTAFEVPAKGRYDLQFSEGKAGALTGLVSLNGTDLLGSFVGLTNVNQFTIDRDAAVDGAAPLAVLGLSTRSTVQDLVDAVNIQIPSVTASLIDDGAGAFFLKVQSNVGGQELRVTDVPGGILDTLFNPGGGVDVDYISANSTAFADDYTVVSTFTPANGGPAQRVTLAGDEGTAITALIGNVALTGSGGNAFSAGSAVLYTTEASELNLQPASAAVVFGRASVSDPAKTTTPPLNIFAGLATAGFADTVESSGVNPNDHTDGTFTINGKTITISSTTVTLQSVLGQINGSGAGVIASYDSALDRIVLRSATTGQGGIALGAATDTSNFLRIAGLNEAGGGTSLVGNDAGSVDPESLLSGAKFTLGPGSGTFTINGVTLTVDTSTDTLNSLLAKITNSAAGVTATYDANTDRVTLVQKLIGDTLAPDITVGSTSDTSNILSSLRLTDLPTTVATVGTPRQQAVFTVDGLSYTRDSNTVADIVPGVTFTLTGVSADPVSLDVSIDTDRALAGIRDFVVEYNSSLELLDPKALNEDERARLKPLTDTERNTLTFNEIELYEAERSLLLQRDQIFRDPTLRRAVSRIRQDSFTPVTGLPSTLDRLSSIGLSTGFVGAGNLDPQVVKGFLVTDSTDPDEILAKLSENTTLAQLLRDGSAEIQDLFGAPKESKLVRTGSVNLSLGITVSSRLSFSIGDQSEVATVTLEAGIYSGSEVLNAIQDAINEAGLLNKLNARITAAGRLELSRTETNGKASILVQDLSAGDSLSALLGLSSGTTFGPDSSAAAGIAQRLEATLKDYTGLTGLVNSQITTGGTLDRRLRSLAEDLATEEDRLIEFENRTRQQFVALEQALAKFQSTQKFLDSRAAALSGTSQ